MAIQTYILTIDDSELTEELRALLQRFGNRIEAQFETSEIDAELAKDLDAASQAIAEGETGASWEEVKQAARKSLRAAQKNG